MRENHSFRRAPIVRFCVAATCLLLAILGSHAALAASPRWAFAGLTGVTVHGLALGAGKHASLYAATENGLYVRDSAGKWSRALNEPGIWTVQVLDHGHEIVTGGETGDINISTDGGNHWVNRFLTVRGVFTVSGVPGRPHSLLAGAGGGIYSSDDGGKHWTKRLKLPQSTATAFAWQPGSANVVFAGTVAGVLGLATTAYRSTDAGRHWHSFGGVFDNNGGIMSLGFGPSTPLFAGTMGHAIWRISPTSGGWGRTASGIPANQHVTAIITLPRPSKAIYIGTLADGAFRSVDGGRHWTAVAAGIPVKNGYHTVSALAYDAGAQMLYAATPAGVYRLPAPLK